MSKDERPDEQEKAPEAYEPPKVEQLKAEGPVVTAAGKSPIDEDDA